MPTNQIHFSTTIKAPAARVWEVMLGPESYKAWAAPFHEGTYYEGSWEQGQRIRFLIPPGQGMLSEIAESRPHEFISIRHIGMIENGVEDTESDAVRSWAPAYENYTFVPAGEGITEIRVDMDVDPAWEQYMQDTWPKALEKLKSLCELATH